MINLYVCVVILELWFRLKISDSAFHVLQNNYMEGPGSATIK